MEQILLAYGYPEKKKKKTVTAIMVLNRSKCLNGDTDFLDIVADVLQGDTLAPYLLIICIYYILRTSIHLMKDNGFTQKRQEADNIQHKLLQMQTMQMTLHFLQIHQPKPNPCCTVWIRQQVAYAST